jgi:hypothetical protein
VVAGAASLSGDTLCAKSDARTVKLYDVSGSRRGMIADVLRVPPLTGVPSRNTENQTGPSSIDDQASETCVGPASVTETSGFVGGVWSGGVVKLTALLYFE